MLAFFTASKWKKWRTSLYCSIKKKQPQHHVYCKMSAGVSFFFFFKQFLHIYTCIHTHTLTPHLVSFCTQCWLIQRKLGLRFHPHLTQDPAVETVVNIRAKTFVWIFHPLWTCRRFCQNSDQKYCVRLVCLGCIWIWRFVFIQYIWVSCFFLSLQYFINCEISAFGWCWHSK